MAETQNGKISSSAPKEKKTTLDGEIGKEFLSSWKTMSVADDDPMDFSFNTVSTGKKKAFNFGKLDLDFDLGGDFGKLSSFSVDMPELDFSSPPSKPAKSKEFSERESTNRICQKNRDSITFSFDFNELEKFDLDLPLIKGKEGAIKNPDPKGLNSDNIQQDLKLKEPVVAEATDNMQGKKLPSDEKVMSSSFENTVAGVGDLGALDGNLLEKKIISCAEETDRQSDSTDKTTQRERHGDKMVAQSLGGEDHSGETVSDAEEKLFPHDVESNIEHNLTDDAIDIPLSDQANLPPENFEPTPLGVQETHECGSGKTKCGTTVENCTVAEPDEAASASIPLWTTTHVGDINKNLHCLTSNSLVTLRRNAGDYVTQAKEKELATAPPSRFFMLSKVTERQECNPISGGMDFSLVGRKGNAVLHSKLAGDSKLAHEEKKNGETDFLGSEKNVISLCNVRERLQSDGLVVNLKSPLKEVNKEENVVLGSTKNDKIIHNASLEVCPTSSIAKPNKLDPQTCSNPSTGLSSMGLVHNSKIISTERFGAGRKTPDLSSLKILRSKNAIKDQSQAPIKSDFQSNSRIEMEGRVHDMPRSVHAVTQAERKMPVNTSLKRKAPTLMASKVDVEASNPHKRLPPTPSDCSVYHVSNSIIDNLACDQDNNNTENKSNTNSVIDGHTIPGSKSPLEVNAKELDITPTLEDDGNVEKAEAYSKELEDICNMLKKKHEEAKETLVRAIVNNNSLLMLNHPMFDAKIRMVQQFAAKLISDKQC